MTGRSSGVALVLYLGVLIAALVSIASGVLVAAAAAGRLPHVGLVDSKTVDMLSASANAMLLGSLLWIGARARRRSARDRRR
jgi:hypothetical protein